MKCTERKLVLDVAEVIDDLSNIRAWVGQAGDRVANEDQDDRGTNLRTRMELLNAEGTAIEARAKLCAILRRLSND